MSAENRRWVLSGGLASGKSKVREFLADAGIMTIDADAIGHRVLRPDGPAFSQVTRRWPEVVQNGVIDRRALAAVVFNDVEELAMLESITHPHIFDTIRDQVEGIDAPVVVEVPLIAHGLGDEWRRMVVDASDSMRLERAVARGTPREDALARLSVQPTRAQWLASAHLVVPNHTTLEDLRSTASKLISKL